MRGDRIQRQSSQTRERTHNCQLSPRSLALVYWLLAREMLKLRGTLKSDLEFELAENVDDWESTF